ncbi:MAG: 30S ribosomal protein S3 [Parcubacteria group bacterium]|nr:30S ribosomal protein S3 [Parcubacteria group bacterium]
MGNKIKPSSLRLGIINDWNSRWFVNKKNARQYLEEDIMLRRIIGEKIGVAGISSVNIERTANACRIFIRVSRPGLVIGRGGKGIEDLKKLLESAVKKLRAANKFKEPLALNLNVEELKRSDVSAAVSAQNIAWDLEKRFPFRRTIKKNLEEILQHREVLGAKIKVAGRLDGGEIARTEWLGKGKLPLHTLRADIDYGEATAYTTYGTVGVKVWVNKGEVFSDSRGRNSKAKVREQKTFSNKIF